MGVSEYNGILLGAEVINVANNAVTTLTLPDTTDFVEIEAVDHDLRLRFDGVNPTHTTGYTIHKNMATTVYVPVNGSIKLIATSDNPSVTVTYFRVKRDSNT